MASLNKMQIIGNVGADPEVRVFPDGTPTASLSIATTDTWKDKVTNEKKQKTEWHRVVFFRGLARVVEEHVKRGAQLYVEGKLRTRKWTDKQGMDHYSTEIIADDMQMLGKKASTEVETAPKVETPPVENEDIPF